MLDPNRTTSFVGRLKFAGTLLVFTLGHFVSQTIAAIPEPLPGWRMELVADAPTIKHPSVVACAPDGRVFVAEDPMDISLPRADAAEGRIICLHPDGRTTVFAEKLHAVFGLQYLEGKLYVLHNPRFSVFDDDNGVGRNRRELIEQTLPDPSALNWNDHVPANFRLGMDGFFYVACGDKGLYGAQGTDGSRANLQTGGIFRIRPDGTGLEVVSHGVRNILDVALNAEDEQFTYDNTDEHDWMGRFTHMVEAGFYGYPHDFIPRRPYTLWMMADYGAGAACGAFAYTEDALPPEFHGNVFLSDFGKRQIMRVRVERDGGTYRAISKEDLFPNPPGDFRPVGITLGPDGKSIYICDWNHRDEKAKVTVGRLFRLTWTGKDHSTPKPAWYVPAATGKRFEATTSDLVRGLSHPSREVRLTAQRRLPPTKELIALLRDRSAPSLARIHALWALDTIDTRRSARKEIIAATADGDAIVRRQALRQLGTRRATNAVSTVRKGLKDQDASVRFHAATALGRVGDPRSVPALLAALEEQDLFARFSMFTALNRIGTNAPSAWPAIARGLESKSERVREGTRFALRETYDDRLVTALVKLFRDSSKSAFTRKGALELLAALHHRTPEWKGQWWAYHPALKPPPEKTVAWAGTQAVLTTLRDGLREREPALRRACIDGLAAARDTNAAPALRDSYAHETDPDIRAAILGALGSIRDPGALPLVADELRTGPARSPTISAAIAAAEQIGGEDAMRALGGFLKSPDAGASTLAAATLALGRLGAKSATAAVEPLTRHAAPSVRAAAFGALGQLQGEDALATLDGGLGDSSVEVRRAIVKALGDLKSTKAVPSLLKAYADEALRADAFTAMTRKPDERALDVLLDGISSKDATQRNAAHLAIRNLSNKVLASIEVRADTLSSQALTELRHIYAGNKKAEGGPLFARQIKQHSLEEYLDAALKLSGDVARGRRLFGEPGGVNCVSCHRVAGQGSDLGPDLTGAGTQFDRRALAEAILYPSKTVREGYQQITVTLADEEELSGVVKGETADTLTMRDATGREHKLPRGSVKARQNSTLSLMPEGLHVALSLEEFADLIAYLASLKGNPRPGLK
jgi:putative membrane-bound dehydrogenase-like protein